MRYILIILCLTFFLQLGNSQTADTKEITLEDIWVNYKFYAQSVPGFNFLKDGKHYTRLEEGTIKQYDLVSGNFVKDIYSNEKMSSYKFSADESKILVTTESESIYRRSSKATYFVQDQSNGTIEQVFPEGPISNAHLSPDGSKIAFTYMNNMFVKDLSSNKITQMTKDGLSNSIINGMCDWVYEEEYGFTRAFEWNEDGSKIAYIKFDETEVKEFTMTNYKGGLYPEYQTFKYPKVGEKNSKVSIHVYDLKSDNTYQVSLNPTIEYIPRLKWTSNPAELVVFTMNRLQNDLELLLVNTKSQTSTTLLKETSSSYVSIHDNMTFLEDGQKFLWTSDKDGFNHIYLYDMKGKELTQVTKGDFDVTKFYGYDKVQDRVYFQAARKNAMDREIYSVKSNGKKLKVIADKKGTNSAQFSSTFDYYVLNHSDINAPASYAVYNKSGKVLRTIVDNKALASTMINHGVTKVDFMEVPTDNNTKLNAFIIKPNDFDPSKKYPVLMYVYGGPGSQTVTNSWKGQNYWWFQSLAAQGYIIVSVDNRGTGARGSEFKKMTYKELGKYEIQDQINAAKHLGSLDYIDASRIGIFGWSYGGYMSSLAITKGADVFKAAIAVAPVTNWKWYDSVYTERYMQTDKENSKGYEDNSPVNFAHLLKGNYLLVHGGSDDNVHFQHSAEMATALIKANKQYDTYFYPNRNHGIYGDNARIHLYTKMTNFVLNKL